LVYVAHSINGNSTQLIMVSMRPRCRHRSATNDLATFGDACGPAARTDHADGMRGGRHPWGPGATPPKQF
jgi:hypothetical protein